MRKTERAPAATRKRRPRAAPGSDFLVVEAEAALDILVPACEGAWAPAFHRRFARGLPEHAIGELWGHVALRSRWRGSPPLRLLAVALRLLEGHPDAGKARPAWRDAATALEYLLSGDAGADLPELARAVISGGWGRYLRGVLAWRIEADERLAALPKAVPFPAYRALVLRSRNVSRILGLARDPRAVWESWRGSGGAGLPERVVGPGELGDWTAEGRGNRPRRFVLAGSTWFSFLAARRGGIPFHPILPGDEDASWECLPDPAVTGPKALGGPRLAAFLTALPVEPPWMSGNRARGGVEALAAFRVAKGTRDDEDGEGPRKLAVP